MYQDRSEHPAGPSSVASRQIFRFFLGCRIARSEVERLACSIQTCTTNILAHASWIRLGCIGNRGSLGISPTHLNLPAQRLEETPQHGLGPSAGLADPFRLTRGCREPLLGLADTAVDQFGLAGLAR